MVLRNSAGREKLELAAAGNEELDPAWGESAASPAPRIEIFASPSTDGRPGPLCPSGNDEIQLIHLAASRSLCHCR